MTSRSTFHTLLLLKAVTISGGCVMVIELLGTRMLAPHVGTTLYVWTSIIGVILACLSAGYAIGGLIADGKYARHALPVIFASAALLTGIIAIVHDAVALAFKGISILEGSLIISFILFGPITLLLGMVTPLAVRLRYDATGGIGKSAGIVYALSTVGSITGTFLAGYWLIPSFTIPVLLFGIAAALLTCSALVFFGGKLSRPAIGAAGTIVATVLVWWAASSVLHDKVEAAVISNIVADYNTPYGRVYIWETERGPNTVRVLADWESATFVEEDMRDTIIAEYIVAFRLAEHYKLDFQNTLMIGGAGYIFPRFFTSWYPASSTSMDVVEIDPEMLDIAKEYFFYEEQPNVHTITADARQYLNTTDKKYDVIYLDAFAGETTPFHLITKESFQEMDRILTDDGMIALNIIDKTYEDGGQLARSVYATVSEVFPYVRMFPIRPGSQRSNIIVIASKNPEPFPTESLDPQINEFLGLPWVNGIPKGPVLTDDYAPVEFMRIQRNRI